MAQVTPAVHLIGLGHRKRTGKNLLAQCLCDEFENAGVVGTAAAFSFAEALKGVAHDLFEWAGMKTATHYEDHPEEKEVLLPIGKTPRQVMIELGMSMRAIHPDVWVRATLENIRDFAYDDWNKEPAPYGYLAVITDLRFPNEAELLRSFLQSGQKGSCSLIRVDRPQVPESNDIADLALADFDEWDRIFLNDGEDVKTLSDQARHLIHDLKIL